MITAKELATALRPALIRAPSVGPMRFRHAVVDSRKAGRGDIFVALRGEQVDGHDYVAHAAQRGATARDRRAARRSGHRAVRRAAHAAQRCKTSRASGARRARS